MSIRLLTPETIGKIAAGEVVERPSSVVKELVENALDAGARTILVDIRGGGIESIEITDDGIGIAPDDLPLALERHATSKLQAFDDLDTLATLGFRGEALASIAAVSSFEIRSRAADQSAGSAIRVEFGAQEPQTTIACPIGTTVRVRDLFGNVPARRKFLRQPATEHRYISRVIAAYACAYPFVRFLLTLDGRRSINTDGSGQALAAASGVFGVEIGKAALLLEPLDESAAVPGVAVDGWVGAPAVSRSHRQDMIFFVNGRWVQHRAMAYALEEAYHSLLMVGRHPISFMHVHVDPVTIDVNVHPTKAEIKFQDERAVCRAVQRAAHAALARTPHDEMPGIALSPVIAPPSQQPMSIPTPMGRIQAIEPAPSQTEPVTTTPGRSGVPVLRVLGQVGASYIVTEGPDGMYLIDQHAAHERVMYEKLAGQVHANSVDRQPLLDPLLVELEPEEFAAFERSRTELAAIGFDIDLFGGTVVAVRSIPALVKGVDIAERLHLILQELAEGGAGTSWIESVAISAACHTAIRAGQTLSLAEMRELVNDLERTSQPRACGHGRPTMLHMSQLDLEKQFSRR